MTSTTSSTGPVSMNGLKTVAAGHTDDWQRRFGVPWDRVDRAARAVLDRAAAASKRKFADLNASTPGAERRTA